MAGEIEFASGDQLGPVRARAVLELEVDHVGQLRIGGRSARRRLPAGPPEQRPPAASRPPTIARFRVLNMRLPRNTVVIESNIADRRAARCNIRSRSVMMARIDRAGKGPPACSGAGRRGDQPARPSFRKSGSGT